MFSFFKAHNIRCSKIVIYILSNINVRKLILIIQKKKKKLSWLNFKIKKNMKYISVYINKFVFVLLGRSKVDEGPNESPPTLFTIRGGQESPKMFSKNFFAFSAFGKTYLFTNFSSHLQRQLCFRPLATLSRFIVVSRRASIDLVLDDDMSLNEK